MPAKMELEVLLEAVSAEKFPEQLEAFALGILIDSQRYYRKYVDSDASGGTAITGPKLDLGFYYTIALFDALSEHHPLYAKRMMEAVLSFDTVGRYLLEQRPIVLDGKPFLLEPILLKQGIDVDALKCRVYENRAKTVFVHLPDPSHKPIPEAVKKPLSDDVRGELREAARYSEIDDLRKNIPLLDFDFTLLSEEPSEENLSRILAIFAELFAHAKMQDSVKLDILGDEMLPGRDLNEFSLSAFLQTHLSTWLILALVEAPSVAVFNDRLRFLMCLLQRATSRVPVLPIYANADLYLPLITMACSFSQSVLQHHRAFQSCKQEWPMRELTNPYKITNYTNRLHILSGDGKSEPLPVMRYFMTATIEYSYLHGRDHIFRGMALFDYFRPQRSFEFFDMPKMSVEAGKLLNAIVRLSALHFHHAQEVILSAYPIHHQEDPIDVQIKTLAFALLSARPRVYYHKKIGGVAGLEDQHALAYVRKHIEKLCQQSHQDSVHAWCDHILRCVDSRSKNYTPRLASDALPVLTPRGHPEARPHHSLLDGAKALFHPRVVDQRPGHSCALPPLVDTKTAVPSPKTAAGTQGMQVSSMAQGRFFLPATQAIPTRTVTEPPRKVGLGVHKVKISSV